VITVAFCDVLRRNVIRRQCPVTSLNPVRSAGKRTCAHATTGRRGMERGLPALGAQAVTKAPTDIFCKVSPNTLSLQIVQTHVPACGPHC
jgi:hypothetical protein